jgi:hypothetical protein
VLDVGTLKEPSMSKTPDKSSARPEKVDKDQDSRNSPDKTASKKLRPAGEDKENLRQRAEWFRRRTGSDE